MKEISKTNVLTSGIRAGRPWHSTARRLGLTVAIAISSMALTQIGCSRKEKILIDGSSTVYPITEGVAEEYRKKDDKVHVTVGISGTGGGFAKFCTGEIVIADASRSIKGSEKEKCAKSKIEYVEVPVAYDGLAIVVNKQNDFVKKLSIAQLRSIFQSNQPAKNWKDVDASFPDLPIKVFSPGQDSGTFDYFTETVLGKDAKVRPDATFSEDDNVLVTGVAGQRGGIGFFGVAYYAENSARLNLVAVINPETNAAVVPTLETVKGGTYAPLSRPLFVYVNKGAMMRPAVRQFMTFYLEKAGRLSQDVGYIPLEASRYADARKSLGL